ncbi:MAG: ATP-binding protein, partial [Oscillospiraceae bacterium]
IRSYAETLVESSDELSPDLRQNFLGVILSESDRMTHIVQDLLTLSRFDSGHSELSLAPFPFDQAVQAIYDAVLLDAQKHDHTLTLQLDPQLPDVVGDRERIMQVMMNIVSNAIKYTPDGGTIEMTAGQAGDIVWLEVADNGIGIPPEDRSRIFERFYRVDKARSRESGGTGLGLSIAREIILRHEGTLSLVEKKTPGLTLRMELLVRGPRHV